MTKWTIRSSTEYGQSLYSILISSYRLQVRFLNKIHGRKQSTPVFGFWKGAGSVATHSLHCNLLSRMKSITDPYWDFKLATYARYFLKSEGRRVKRLRRFVSSNFQRDWCSIDHEFVIPITCWTSSQVSRWDWLSGVRRMIWSLSEAPIRKSGHCAVHWLLGTFTSQYGRSVSPEGIISSDGILLSLSIVFV